MMHDLVILEFTLHGLEGDEIGLLLEVSQTRITFSLSTNPSNHLLDHELDFHQFLHHIVLLASFFIIIFGLFLLFQHQVRLRLEEFLSNSLLEFVTNFRFQTILSHQMHSEIMPVARSVILLTRIPIVEEIGIHISGKSGFNLSDDFDQFSDTLKVTFVFSFTSL